MPSVFDLALTITTAHIVSLVGHKVFTNIFGPTSREEIQTEDQLERHVKSPEPFSRDVGD